MLLFLETLNGVTMKKLKAMGVVQSLYHTQIRDKNWLKIFVGVQNVMM